MAEAPQISGNNEIRILDRETSRGSPIAAGGDRSRLRKLLAEDTAIRKEIITSNSRVKWKILNQEPRESSS